MNGQWTYSIKAVSYPCEERDISSAELQDILSRLYDDGYVRVQVENSIRENGELLVTSRLTGTSYYICADCQTLEEDALYRAMCDKVSMTDEDAELYDYVWNTDEADVM